MNSSKKLASGIVWTTLYNIVNSIYGFISVPILIEHFGKDQYGLIGLALSINIYMQLMDLGFNSTNIRFFSVWLSNKDHGRLKRAFSSSLAFYGIIGLINALILIAITCFSNHIFEVTQEQNVILRELFIILIISAIINWYSSCFDQLIKSTENVAWVQRRSFIPKFIQIILLYLVVKLDLSLVTYFCLTTFAFISIIPVSIRKIKNLLPFISFLPKWDKSIMKEMLPYCLGIFSFNIFQFSFYNLRAVFLGIEGSLDDVADYRILNGILTVVTLFAGMFISVLLPTTSKIVAEGNRVAIDKVVYEGTKYISIIVVFCSFGIMSVGYELLTLYVGDSYLYLIPVLNLWLICSLSTHNQAISSIVLAGSNLKPIAINSALASVVGLVTAWILIPYTGVAGTIWAFVVYLLIQLSFYYLYYWPRVMGINSWRVFYYSFFPPVIVGIISYYTTRTINFGQSIWGNFFLNGICFSIVYLLLQIFILRKSDILFAKTILQRNRTPKN